jgi:DNA-binding phage protein
MDPISQIKARVRQAIKEGHSPGSLARLAGLHRNSLYGCESDEWNPTARTLEALLPHLPKAEKAA